MRQSIQGKNRVREERPHGSVRGAPGNRRPYRDRPRPRAPAIGPASGARLRARRSGPRQPGISPAVGLRLCCSAGQDGIPRPVGNPPGRHWHMAAQAERMIPFFAYPCVSVFICGRSCFAVFNAADHWSLCRRSVVTGWLAGQAEVCHCLPRRAPAGPPGRRFPAVPRESHSAAHRMPSLPPRWPGSTQPRYDARTSLEALPHEPPRGSLYWPLSGPDGSACAPDG